MTLEFTIHEQDVRDAYKLACGTRLQPWAALGAGIGVGLVAMLIHPDVWAAAPLAAVIALLATANAGGNWREGKQLVGHIMSIATTDDGLSYASPLSTSRLSWRLYHMWKEGPTVFLVYPNNSMFNVIPKRAFRPEQIEEFRAMLQQNIGPAGQPRK